MRTLTLLSAFLGLTTAASVSSPLSPRSSSTSSGACNNSPSLCSKAYNSITHLGAHDSPFVRDATTGFSTSGNQYYNSTVQLAAGVRLLSAQVHTSNNAWHLCHSSCDLLDAGLLSTWLGEIKKWMDANPNEVVTVLLVNSDKATPSQLHAEFTKSGITQYAYNPSFSSAPSSWPTLQTLISSGTRLVTFVAGMDLTQMTSETAYLMDEFTYIFENPYSNLAFTDFSCDPDRPTGLSVSAALSSNRMPFMNHFLYKSLSGVLSDIETPNVDNITITNSPNLTTQGTMGQSADNCTKYYGGKAPTFILVDFFDEGPAINTVDRLNGVSSAVGRTKVPARPTHTVGNTASWAGVQALVQQVQGGEVPTLGAWIWGSGKWSWGGINLSGGDILA